MVVSVYVHIHLNISIYKCVYVCMLNEKIAFHTCVDKVFVVVIIVAFHGNHETPTQQSPKLLQA